MPNFVYTATNEIGKKISGTMSAATQDELASMLDGQQLFLIQAKEVSEAKTYSFAHKVKTKDLLTFTLYLNTLITAGVPLLIGMKQIADQTEDLYLKRVINGIADDIRGGRSISESMVKHPKVFNELYVSMIKAGEASGNLDAVLADLAVFIEWQEELRKKVKKATVYPCVLLGTVGTLIAVLVIFVFPKFMTMFNDIHMELPEPTKIVIAVSDFFKNYGLISLGGVILFTVGYIVANRFPAGKLVIDRYKLHLPVAGMLIQKISVSRFTHYLGVMLKAGVNVIEAFTIVERLVGNAAIAQVVKAMREMILGGQKISEAMERYTEFPPLVVQMVSVGEMSGKLEENLNKVSKFYDREVPEAIDKTLGMLQPIIMIAMAGVVALVALAIFLPMFQMASAIKQG